MCRPTNLAAEVVPAISALFRRIVNPAYAIRRVGLTCNSVMADTGDLQLNMFEDVSKQLREKALQETLLGIRARYHIPPKGAKVCPPGSDGCE